MKKQLLALSAAAVLLAPQAAGAEGFAINEWSAEGVAMGGARMFAEGDAANIAYNPASITKVDFLDEIAGKKRLPFENEKENKILQNAAML